MTGAPSALSAARKPDGLHNHDWPHGDLSRLYYDKDQRGKFTKTIKDPALDDFWNGEFKSYDDRQRREVQGPIVSHKRSTLNIRTAIDNGYIIIVNSLSSLSILSGVWPRPFYLSGECGAGSITVECISSSRPVLLFRNSCQPGSFTISARTAARALRSG